MSAAGRTAAAPARARPAGWILPRRVVRESHRRAGALPDVQLLCGAGPYELDLIVRELPSELDIGGQVTRGDAVYDPVGELELALVEAEAEAVLSSTRTDDFGEFDFRAAGDRMYGLRVGAGPETPVVLIWEGER